MRSQPLHILVYGAVTACVYGLVYTCGFTVCASTCQSNLFLLCFAFLLFCSGTKNERMIVWQHKINSIHAHSISITERTNAWKHRKEKVQIPMFEIFTSWQKTHTHTTATYNNFRALTFVYCPFCTSHRSFVCCCCVVASSSQGSHNA